MSVGLVEDDEPVPSPVELVQTARVESLGVLVLFLPSGNLVRHEVFVPADGQMFEEPLTQLAGDATQVRDTVFGERLDLIVGRAGDGQKRWPAGDDAERVAGYMLVAHLDAGVKTEKVVHFLSELPNEVALVTDDHGPVVNPAFEPGLDLHTR